MGIHGDPVASGVASNLARPGGNVTGISNMGLELVGKRIDLLREVMPTLSELATLRGRLRHAGLRTSDLNE